MSFLFIFHYLQPPATLNRVKMEERALNWEMNISVSAQLESDFRVKVSCNLNFLVLNFQELQVR